MRLLPFNPKGCGGGWGVFLIWLILGCAAGQGRGFDLSVHSVFNESGIYVWEKGFSKTTNKQSQTNDRNR